MSSLVAKGWIHRSAFGRHGTKVVTALCAYEVVALQAPFLPTLSELVKRYPVFGWTLLVLLAHHWYLED